MKKLNLKSSTIIIIATLSICFFSSCKENQENEIKQNNTECSFINPLTDLPWLKQKVSQLSQGGIHARIYQCTYQNGKIGFLIESCVGCPDSGLDLRDCSGTYLCTMWGFSGSNCPEYNVNYEDAVIIYEINNK